MEKTFVKHSSGLLVSRDGEVFVPKSGKNPAHYTYGWKREDGYRTVQYQGKLYLVHRLVAECFIPNPENKPEIDHINTNRSDNRVENLRWSTRGENQNNPLTRHKIADTLKKPIIGTHKTTGEIVEFESATDAWITLNISQGNITSCCQGNRKSAGGYEWHYKQNPLEEIYAPDIKPSLEEFFKALDDFMMEQ